jgi:predicted transcriptional regulator
MTLLEMAAEIVSSHASTTPMSGDELLQEIQKVYASLQAIGAGQPVAGEAVKPAITVKDAFKKNEVICMICGKGKLKALTRHLKAVHDMKPSQYKKQFGIPSKQPLTAKSFTEARRKSALDRGLGDNLAKAREVRASKLKEKKAAPVKLAKLKPAKKVAPVKPVKVGKPKVAKKTKP